jgi:RNA recognition motif-containing protein
MKSVKTTTISDRFSAQTPYLTSASKGGNKRVYVGNLSPDVDWKVLKEFFRQFGAVKHADVTNGYGILEFETSKTAGNVIREANGVELKGRRLNVREDREASTNVVQPKNNILVHVHKSEIGSKLYVGNLSYDVSWQDLKDHFKQAGNVIRADVLTDSSTNKSKGCGLIEMSSSAEAQTAISELNDTELRGRLIFVREDREAEAADDDAAKLYVGNLAWSVQWQNLKDHFKQVGRVLRADVITDREGKSKGFGLVTMGSAEEAERAIAELSDTELMGRNIVVREDRRHDE